ncbi:hypothetical protein POM88_012815 [Heracleum sosnowskyi]|uniref:Uncharacterized protein n=1 Tax=Heracleum sosnowskyi TaxID=360622 RepID=A0AAD8IX72_9APIA|nr:hypothetical protein POM88_012815 [Heracleum sosnowskyi]
MLTLLHRGINLVFNLPLLPNYKGFILGFHVITLEIRDDLIKVSEVGGILGRAGTVGLGKAVEVLDTLGSSMTNLNLSSNFVSGVATKVWNKRSQTSEKDKSKKASNAGII